MTTLYLNSILDDFFNYGSFNTTSNIDYPQKPHNIYIDKEGNLFFEVAAQGCEKENIKVSSKSDGRNNKIIIEVTQNVDHQDRTYLVSKLSNSSIKLEYNILDTYDMENVEVNLKKGLLFVKVPIKPECKEKEYNFEIE